MAEFEKELDWEDEITEESSFIILPEGEYDFEITKLERGRFAGSDKLPPCPKATVSFLIESEKGKVTINRDFFLHTSTERYISEMYISIGLKKRGDPCKMQWNQVVGRRGRCHVSVDRFHSKKDGELQYDAAGKPVMLESNKIKYFIDPPEDSGPAQSQFNYTAGRF